MHAHGPIIQARRCQGSTPQADHRYDTQDAEDLLRLKPDKAQRGNRGVHWPAGTTLPESAASQAAHGNLSYIIRPTNMYVWTISSIGIASQQPKLRRLELRRLGAGGGAVEARC